MKPANDNPIDIAIFNPFGEDDGKPAPQVDVCDLVSDAFDINEFLATTGRNYPEMQNSPLWQEILLFANRRYDELFDGCYADGGAA